MSRCDSRSICSFYERYTGELSTENMAMISSYCKSDREHCARYLVKRKIFEGYYLPGDQSLDKVGRQLEHMAPTEHAKARRIIQRMVI